MVGEALSGRNPTHSLAGGKGKVREKLEEVEGYLWVVLVGPGGSVEGCWR
jgi:hypothetical protein